MPCRSKPGSVPRQPDPGSHPQRPTRFATATDAKSYRSARRRRGQGEHRLSRASGTTASTFGHASNRDVL
eukprot:3971076-Pyramimonas_sp.AAC.1